MNEIELQLWILWISGREYQASILRSPHGLGTHRFVVPENSSLWADEEAGTSEDARNVKKRAAWEPSPLRLLQIQGSELFRLVFAGENLEPFKKCLADAEANRVRLRLRLTFQNAPAAADWPWEALVVGWTGQFLANMPKVSFERVLGLEQRAVVPPMATNGYLHILVVSASPSDMTRLSVIREKSRILAAFKQAGVSIKVRTATSRATLGKVTASKVPFDLIHVISHGDFADNEGGIWLEDELKEGSRISSPELPAFLRKPAALVFLNVCDSGRGAHDPFAGLAEALIRAKTAAVVAMRRPIGDEGAVKLAQTFYQHLAQGLTVATSLAEWREASSRNDADWAVPVLYLAGEDFAISRPSAANVESEKEPPPEKTPSKWKWIAAAAVAILAGAGSYRLWPKPPPAPCLVPQLQSDSRCPQFPGLDLPLAFVEGEAEAADFCLGKFEITRGQYSQVMRSRVPATGQAWLPQEYVSWNDGLSFADALRKLNTQANCYLPRNAQWEFAARARRPEHDPTKVEPANCAGDEDGFAEAACVGSFAPNAWGLYDMTGNVWEWTQDATWKSRASLADLPGPEQGSKRIRRGGGYVTAKESCSFTRSAEVEPGRKQEAAGFRIACDPVGIAGK